MTRKTIRSIAVLAAAALSTLAITCRSADSLGPAARTVELRQVQQVAAAFNKIIDQAITNRSSGATREFVDICPDRPTFRVHKGIVANKVSIVRSSVAIDPPAQITVVQLRELRALMNLRVDEAFQSGDASAYRDLLSVKLDGNGLTGNVSAPRASVQISELQ
ncbi:MAG TPA: hypothetical protein VEO54_05395 [Thermoanaerobaculia bacterium]|nr:hypothetical protein [Thermoanaerobaculia bacterium]